MHRLLFCCVGNTSLSPLMAALYNAEAAARGLDAIALSAGLTSRREVPRTTPFLLRAVAAEVGDRPAVTESMRVHEPRPLLDLPFLEVDGVCYLHEPARKPRHLGQDLRAIERWLLAGRGGAVMRLAVADEGYRAWEAERGPDLDSIGGRAVVGAYRRTVLTVRGLASTLLAATAPAARMTAASTLAVSSEVPTTRRIDRSAHTSSGSAAGTRHDEVPPAGEARAAHVSVNPPPPLAPPPRSRRSAVRPAGPPEPSERDLALCDVRAWLRAAMPTKRPVLVRYGLWARAQEHFGSWSAAVQAAGMPVEDEPLWELPSRDPELSFDILVEALPNDVVARLCDVSEAKVRRRRRDNGAPDIARQLHRRVLGTGQLGIASDESLAARLGITAAEVAAIRVAEASSDAAPASDQVESSDSL